MKPLKLVLSLLFIANLFSCTKDSESENETEPTITTETGITVEQSDVSHKFIINNSNTYESIEFNASGNYIVVQNSKAESVLFGTYSIIDNKEIKLTDFGSLIFTNLSGTTANLILKLDGSNEELALEAKVAEEVELSGNSALINRTWEVTSLGEFPVNNFYVFISAAGTYMVDNQFMGDLGVSYGVWEWCNEEKTKLTFAMEDVPLDCEGINVIDEIVITENSFTGTDYENGGAPMEIIMVPADGSSKSSSNKQALGIKILGVQR